jgi:dTDP-4-dehydrorhamnose reductase
VERCVRALILGGTGMLGRAVVGEARARGWSALAPSHGQADIGDRDRLVDLGSRFAPELLINCAAFTKVDDCETRREHALAANGYAVGNLVALADRLGARLVQVSSDYVFDGRASTPYAEDAATGPLSVYGESKLLGERAALDSPRSLVVRASWLFGPGGPNFVATMLKLFARQRADGTPVRVVADQVGAPTYTPFLARALCDFGAAGASGVVHYRNREAVSWHGFAEAIADLAGFSLDIAAITTADFPRPAPRPAYSLLAVEKAEALLGRTVETWSAGLAQYLDLIRRRMDT